MPSTHHVGPRLQIDIKDTRYLILMTMNYILLLLLRLLEKYSIIDTSIFSIRGKYQKLQLVTQRQNTHFYIQQKILCCAYACENVFISITPNQSDIDTLFSIYGSKTQVMYKLSSVYFIVFHSYAIFEEKYISSTDFRVL